MQILNGSPANVIRVTFAQLARETVCFLALTSLTKCQRGFVQRAWSDGWIVVKQGDSFKGFAGVIEVPALELDFTGKQTRFRVYPTFGLKRHDFFSDLLCLIGFMSADLNRPERQQHLRLTRGIFGSLEIFREGFLSFGQIP